MAIELVQQFAHAANGAADVAEARRIELA